MLLLILVFGYLVLVPSEPFCRVLDFRLSLFLGFVDCDACFLVSSYTFRLCVLGLSFGGLVSSNSGFGFWVCWCCCALSFGVG